jgi:hypothetical protein
VTPFLDISLQPGYGDKQCVVRWRLAAEFQDGDVYVYRAPTAAGPWTLLNDNAPARAGSFTDTAFVVTDSTTRPHYRLCLEHRTGDYDSPVIGLFDKLSRKEFGIVRRVMKLELLHMREGKNGIEVLVYKPKRKGPRCRCVDKATGQSSQASLCPYCYGTTFEGGFYPPVWTWLEAERWSERKIEDNPSGAGSVDTRLLTANILAFPELDRGDVIVHRELDNRFAVIVSDPKLFHGTYPIKQVAQLVLLQRQDIRYRIPLPDLS